MLWKKRSIEVVDWVRIILQSEYLKNKYRTEEKYFTRNRIFTLPRLAVLIMRGMGMPMQNAINKFFQELGDLEQRPTASAYSQAREKFRGELFLELLHGAVERFYKHDETYEEDVKLWKGMKLLGVDGTTLNLPDTMELRAQYSISRNQHEIERVQAMATVLYDLLNDIPLSVIIGKQRPEKEYLFCHHQRYIGKDAILIMDQGYLDYSVMARFTKKHRLFIIRGREVRTFNRLVEFALSNEKVDEVTTLSMPQSQKEYVEKKHLPKEIEVRMIKVPLDEEKSEILVTNIFDEAITNSDFKELYSKRWNEETYFDRLKNFFQAEKFSGMSSNAVKQDFYGTVFLSCLESILMKDTDKELKEKSQTLKYNYQVNRSVSISTMLNHTVSLLLDETKSTGEVFEELKSYLKKNPCLRRSNRKFERRQRSGSWSLYYNRYKKKLTS